jgi:mandelamide amidase
MNILRRITAAAILLSCCAAAPATPPMDVTQLTVTEAAKLIRDGKITSEELTTALLTKIAIHQDLNAFITVNAMDALESARAADQERRRGHKRMGPLHGVPLLVKDNIHVAGLPNTAGTPGLEDFVPGANAPTVQALVDAGAIVLAKTNMHELAFGITSNNTEFGPVRNPYDKTRIAGGSSGGNASAIAARLAPGAIGTDTGGSVRIPAALCGIAALRPTIDRYSQIGVTPISHTRDTVGPMARTVEDLMLLDSVLTGDRDKSKKAKAKKIRLGVVPEMFQNIDNETSALVQHALNKLRRADVEVVPLQVSGFLQLDDQAGFPIALFEARQDLTSYLAQYGTGLTQARTCSSCSIHSSSLAPYHRRRTTLR